MLQLVLGLLGGGVLGRVLMVVVVMVVPMAMNHRCRLSRG
jgi:hypothetical protein